MPTHSGTDSQLSGDFDADHFQPFPLGPQRSRSSSYYTFDLVVRHLHHCQHRSSHALLSTRRHVLLIVEDMRLSRLPALISLHTNPPSL